METTYRCTKCTYTPLGFFSADFHEWATGHLVLATPSAGAA